MSNKDLPEDGWVKLESKQCLVCGDIHNHDCGILLSKKLKKIKSNGPNNEFITGYGLCKKHASLKDNGFTALLEIIPPSEEVKKIEIQDMERTGRYLHISENLARNLMSIPDGEEVPYLMCIDKGGYDKIVKMYEEQFPDSTETIN